MANNMAKKMPRHIFFHNRRLTTLVIGLILVAGFGALSSLPRQEDPSFTHRFDTVNTRLPGASAERVDALVTEKIEAALSGIDEIKEIKSTSRAGMSTIRIKLEDDVKIGSREVIWSEIRDKLKDARQNMPPEAGTPRLLGRENAVYTMMIGLTWALESEPQIDILGRFAKDLERKISPLPGTKETEIFGEPQEEYSVIIDPDALASVGLTARDVSAAIARSDAKIPAGQMRGGSGQSDSGSRRRA